MNRFVTAANVFKWADSDCCYYSSTTGHRIGFAVEERRGGEKKRIEKGGQAGPSQGGHGWLRLALGWCS